MKNVLLELFRSMLSQRYTEAENAASFAYQVRGESLYIWLEPSNGVIDWFHNLSFAAVPYREMQPEWRCHAGFLTVWKSLLPHLKTVIFSPSVKSACVVGYSHGAALATLCHEYIYYHRPDLRERLCGYGFGCPRVLHGCVPAEIAARWEEFYMIHNIDDIVTHLPPRKLGYCHVGNLVTIGEKGLYSPIDAHRPESYLKQLERAALGNHFFLP